MIKFLDLHKINARFEEELKNSFSNFLDSGYYILGNQTAIFEKEFAAFCGTKYCIGVSNGLDALRLIFEGYKELGQLQPGDEVIVPANTFIASFLAVSQSGLLPVPVEPNPVSFTLDPEKVKEAVGKNTKAIMAVHLYGQLAEMPALKQIADQHNLLLIEDAAQAHGAVDVAGSKAGSLSHAAAFSFYPTKNLGALGDGGAVTTQNKELYEIIGKLRNYGSSSKYKNDLKGFNFRLDEVQAGFLSIKLTYLEADNNRRCAIANRYIKKIKNAAIQLPDYSGGGDHVFHLFVIRCKERDRLQEYLKQNQIQTLIHYPIPPHKQLAYSEYEQLFFPITEAIHNEVLSLPISPVMTDDEVDRVITVLNNF